VSPQTGTIWCQFGSLGGPIHHKRVRLIRIEQSSGLTDANLGVQVELNENCEVPLLEETFSVPLPNKVHIVAKGVPLATDPGISLIILPLMRILQRNLKRTTDTFLFISHTTNVLFLNFRCNIFIGVRIIKEMPGSVASWTQLYFLTVTPKYTFLKVFTSIVKTLYFCSI